jgi:CRISPR-associated endonuclease Csn1
MPDDQMLFAGRELIRQEFHRIVEVQRSFQESELSAILTDELVRQLDDPTQTRTWRHRGLLFGQRRTYWDTGTLGRCVLEPTDRCVPIADRHASYFRVIETVNNIRIALPGESKRPLEPEERQRVMDYLRGASVLPMNPLGLPIKMKPKAAPKDVKPKHLQEILGIDPKVLAKHGYATGSCELQIAEADPERSVNTDWFHREIVHGAIGAETWCRWEEAERREANLPESQRSPKTIAGPMRELRIEGAWP